MLVAPGAAAPPSTAAWTSRGDGGAAAAGEAVGCRCLGGDSHSPTASQGRCLVAVQRGWFPARGRGSAGGTDGLSLLCFCLWPTCGGGRIRVRGWGMDVGQQETDGAAGPALLLAPFPPSCLRQAGDKPSLCPARACSPPHAAAPLPGQQAVGCSPPAISTPSPAAPVQGVEPQTPFTCHGF